MSLKLEICEIDLGRFEDLAHVLGVTDTCGLCDFFNLSIKDYGKQYRCHCMPKCIAATLHPHLISYLNWKLGWIDEKMHMGNLGLSSNQAISGAGK